MDTGSNKNGNKINLKNHVRLHTTGSRLENRWEGCIYTPLLVVSLFTDEGSHRLPKHLLRVIALASVPDRDYRDFA